MDVGDKEISLLQDFWERPILSEKTPLFLHFRLSGLNAGEHR